MSTLGSRVDYRKLRCIEPFGFMNHAFFKWQGYIDTKNYFIIIKTTYFEIGYRERLKHCHLYFAKY